MQTLMIKDLAVTEELDRKAMSAVSGGMKKEYWPLYKVSSHDFSFSAAQSISQSQDTVNQNGNNVAFANGITSTVKPTQTANNSISF